MSQFETIVRPFQRTGVSYPERIFDTTQKPVVDVTLSLGLEGSTKTFQESFASNITTYKDAQIKELSRETKKKRITNPEDSSQYVDVENIQKLTTEQGKGRNYKKSEYEFSNS
jgi:antirestriction protein